jgi:hypothetical protein
MAFDPNLVFGQALAGQISYIRHAQPTQAALMDRLEEISVSSAEELLANCDVVVVSHATDAFRRAVAARPDHVHVLDLARLFRSLPDDATYQGIAW